jgi:hypothetical protein
MERTIHINVFNKGENSNTFVSMIFHRDFPDGRSICNIYNTSKPERMKLAGRIFLKTMKQALEEVSA